MSVELPKLPPMDLLRGFVAVGRRMSITQAAIDLCLTQSAVSRQIQALEVYLGVPLLVRGHRSLAFSAEGERLFRSADGAIQQLQDVIGEVRVTGRLRPVTISAATGFAALWLLPRLGNLQRSHPEIDVRISANNQLVDLRSEGIDLSIRYTDARRAPAGSTRLFGEVLAPVAAASLQLKPVRSAAAFSRLTLLEFDDPRTPLEVSLSLAT
jgi:DNA-binding transcriptional LysR family regulator